MRFISRISIAGCVLLTPFAPVHAATTNRPNIVFIFSDAQESKPADDAQPASSNIPGQSTTTP